MSKEPRGKPRGIWRDRLCPVRCDPWTTRRSSLQEQSRSKHRGIRPKGNEARIAYLWRMGDLFYWLSVSLKSAFICANLR